MVPAESSPGLVLRALRSRGLRFVLDYALESALWDWRHGTDTHLRVPKSGSIGQDRSEYADGVLYVASFTTVVRETLKIARSHLGASLANRAQFVDLGCGKGKALLVCAFDLGSATVLPALGIEYDPGLVKIARANAAKMGFGPAQVKVVCDSALSVRRHVEGEVLVVYLYNPFRGATLKSTLLRLEAIPHVLVYVDPVERELLFGMGYELIESRRGRYAATTWMVAASRSLCETQARRSRDLEARV